VELFEQIRREYTHGVGTIQGTARKLGVHRRMVRQALARLEHYERDACSRIACEKTFTASGSREVY
jgi:hypothetical protein